jgi:hypothetical protein
MLMAVVPLPISELTMTQKIKVVAWLSRVLVLGVAIASPQIAEASGEIRVTQSSGNVVAELSYNGEVLGAELSQFANFRLRIARAGQTLIDQDLVTARSTYGNPSNLQSSGNRPFPESLKVVDLNQDGELEILFDFGNRPGGCCTYTQIYRYDPEQQTYSYTEHFWGYAGYRLRDLNEDGTPEFLTNDNLFAYPFGFPSVEMVEQLQESSYAPSVLPLRVLQYQDGRMADVTRQHPREVGSHAYILWSHYWQRQSNGDASVRTDPTMRSVWAAYLANKHLLGQAREGWQMVEQAYQGSDRQQFFNNLRTLLQQNGYVQES